MAPNPKTVEDIRQAVMTELDGPVGPGSLIYKVCEFFVELLEAGEIHGYPGEMMEIGAWCIAHDHDYKLCWDTKCGETPVPLYREVTS